VRLIDFFVYYEATLYKSKEEESRSGNRRLNKAIGIAAIIVAIWLMIFIQLFSYLFFRINVININAWKVVYLINALLIYIILRYVYLSNGRYQYVISDEYKFFTMSKFVGVFLMFLILMVSIGLSISVGVYLGNF